MPPQDLTGKPPPRPAERAHVSRAGPAATQGPWPGVPRHLLQRDLPAGTPTRPCARAGRGRAILEIATGAAIFTTSAEGRIGTWPAGAAAGFGWSAEEAAGRRADTTHPGVPEGRRRVARGVRRPTCAGTARSPTG